MVTVKVTNFGDLNDLPGLNALAPTQLQTVHVDRYVAAPRASIQRACGGSSQIAMLIGSFRLRRRLPTRAGGRWPSFTLPAV